MWFQLKKAAREEKKGKGQGRQAEKHIDLLDTYVATYIISVTIFTGQTWYQMSSFNEALG